MRRQFTPPDLLLSQKILINDIARVNQKILVLDRAMGTMILRYTLTEDDFRNDELGQVERGNARN
jgi:methionine synthase I (cobalamin-dependent)